MAERESTRERQPEPIRMTRYEEYIKLYTDEQERLKTARMVVRGKELEWEQNRQALVKFYTHPNITDTALRNLMIFVQDIRTKSGRHTHQGGFALYILEGRGYTVVDGERIDWEEGDLVLLPIKPGGVEHQHFNLDPDKPSKWLAITSLPLEDALGRFCNQVELHPDYHG